MLTRILASLLIAATTASAYSQATDDAASSKTPVKAIADHSVQVRSAEGAGVLPVYLSIDGAPVDWTHPMPSVTRALIVFHGKLRDADVYNRSGLQAVKNAGAAGKGTLLITPQFLEQVDVDQYHLPPNVLRWAPQAWMAGDNALNQPLSSFAAIDAILLQLADRTRFPNLKHAVVAGHSGGGQVVQRYAVVGTGGDTLMRFGVHVRYVVANPSSYVYFSPERPALDPHADFTFALPAKTCFGKYNHWKYGVEDPPPYVDGAAFPELEQRYLRRDVVYLLGAGDTDPNHPALDKSCSGEDEGPYRFFRGKAYFRYLELRHPELATAGSSQQLWFVPGIGHEGDKMLNSPCGLAALFDSGSCTTRSLDPKP